MTENRNTESSTALAQASFREAEKRLKKSANASPPEQRTAWRLYNFYYYVERLARTRESLSRSELGDERKQTLSSAEMNLVAAQCHEALHALLEAIGLHSQHKDWILRKLTFQLIGLSDTLPERRLSATWLRDQMLYLVERETKTALYSSQVSGSVVEHTEKAMIVRFDLDGLIEERSFWWDELSVSADEVPIGTSVIGFVQLAKAPNITDETDPGDATRQIHQDVEREMEKQVDDAFKSLATPVSPEDAARFLEEWKAIAKTRPEDAKNPPREG